MEKQGQGPWLVGRFSKGRKASETKNSFETRERGEAPTRELVRFLTLVPLCKVGQKEKGKKQEKGK